MQICSTALIPKASAQTNSGASFDISLYVGRSKVSPGQKSMIAHSASARNRAKREAIKSLSKSARLMPSSARFIFDTPLVSDDHCAQTRKTFGSDRAQVAWP